MNASFQDLRFAFRQLRRSPGFTLTAIATLALGLGASAAVFSVIYAVLLSPLPYPDADRLVGIAFTFPHEKPNAEQTGNAADFIRGHLPSLASTAVLDDGSAAVNLSVKGGRAVQINSLRVSEGYFRTLGVMPALGRGFTADEDIHSGGNAVVLSDGLWSRLFGRDPSAIGSTIRVNEENFTVVGVMPASFAVTAETAPGVLGTPDIWQPLQLSAKTPGYDGDNFEMIGRLAPGATLAQAQQELSALNEPFYQQFPFYKTWLAVIGNGKSAHEFRVWKLQDVLVSGVRRSLLTVMGAVLAVLLVACLNLAGLMIARSLRRVREIAVRSALGASRTQLVRLLACEGMLLALGGGLLAILVAREATELLLHASPLTLPDLHGGTSLWVVSVVTMAFALGAMCIFSLLPAVMLLRNSGATRLAGTSVGETVSHARVSRALLVTQVALAMVLVSTASVLLGTFVKLGSIPSGVEPKQLTVFQVTLKGDRYANTAQTGQFVTTVLDQLRTAPGVDRVAAINGLPLDRGLNIGGYPAAHIEQKQIVEFRSVTPGYFRTMGIPVLAGRDIADSDRAAGDPVVVIGVTAAKKLWPGRSPLGELIRIGNERNWRIVGVVADTRTHSLVETGGVVVYAPMAQLSNEFTGMINGWFPTTFTMRTAAHLNLATVAQRAVERADPEIPVARLTTMQGIIDATIEEPRFFSFLASGFSGFAVVLTVIGLFGLLSYQVTQRTREIGLRMALGADRANILRTFMGRGLAVACAGVVLGLAATWFIRPIIFHLLADAGVDPAAGGGSVVMSGSRAALVAALAMLTATLGASWLPARRAASIEPMQALRNE